MKYLLNIFILLFCITAFSQENRKMEQLSDSLNLLYSNYFELLKSSKKMDTVASKLQRLDVKYTSFEDLIGNNQKEIKKLSDKNYNLNESLLKQRRNKIVLTTDFVFAANASLNAIKQLDATSTYLLQISTLNNPNNTELGFSLSTQMNLLLEQNIIKGNNKINGVKKGKFLSFVDNIIKSPISEFVSSAVPVVSSIKSVIDLVMNSALGGKDVSIDNIVALKDSLKDYVQHYEGLAQAQANFEQNLDNLDVRKESLVLLLTQFTQERVNTLSPNEISQDDIEATTLTMLINEHYSSRKVGALVDDRIAFNKRTGAENSSDQQLVYPEYAMNQAKFIRDEIESLSKEYISIYASHQAELNKVLTSSKKIGNATKIDEKLQQLKNGLGLVKISFQDNVNIAKLNEEFTDLTRI